MTVQFSIAHRDPVTLIGYNGEGSVKYNVTGYKREYLEVKVRRDTSWREDDPKVEWKIDLETPRWGRDQEQEPCNIKVAKYMRAAMADAIIEMESIQKQIPLMEKEFARGQAERQAEADRKAAEKQAKIDADKPVGHKLAKTICDEMVRQARATEQDSQEIVFQTRGEHREIKMRCVYTYSGLTLFNIGWGRVSRKDAVAKLADGWLASVDTGDVKDSIPDARLAGFMMGGKN
jgi:hypothetical protein